MTARFGRELELFGVDWPATIRAGAEARLQYYWRPLSPMSHNYWVFVHIQGAERQINRDHFLGVGTYGTEKWAVGEEIRESFAFRLPPDTPPGVYRVKLGVWLPETGKRLRITETDLPLAPRSVEIGTLTVVGPSRTDRSVPRIPG